MTMKFNITGRTVRKIAVRLSVYLRESLTSFLTMPLIDLAELIEDIEEVNRDV